MPDTAPKPIETVGDVLDNLPVPHSQRIAITPMQMLAGAIERGADITVLDKLMDLRDRWEAGEARKAFVAALAEFKKDPPTIIKNKKANFGQGKAAYEFAGLDQIAAVIGAALAKQGLSASWRTDQTDNKIRVTCTLRHALGHGEETALEAPADTSGSKNPIQAVGSTITYLSKYTLLSITGLAAGDQDDDGAGMAQRGPTGAISEEQKAALVDLLKESDADIPKFLGYFKTETLDGLPAARFADAKALLQQKINATKTPSAA